MSEKGSFNFSLRMRLLLLVVLAAVPAFALILHSGLELKRQAAENARKDALQIAQLAANDHRQVIDETHQLLHAVAHLPPFWQDDFAECVELFRELQSRYPRYATFGLARTDGSIICGVPPTSEPADLASQPYFRRALQKDNFSFSGYFTVSGYMIGQITGKPVVAFAYPVIADGEVISVLVTGVHLDWLNPSLARFQLPPGSLYTVTDGKKNVLMRDIAGGKWLEKAIDAEALVAAIDRQRAEEQILIPELDDVARFYSFIRLYDFPGADDVFLVTGIPADAVLAPAEEEMHRSLALLAVVVGLTVLAGWAGSEWFLLRQIRSLHTATSAMAAGELSARTEMSGYHSEIGALGRSFNDMAEALERRTTEAERLTRIYAVLSGINEAILRIRDRGQLIAEACRIGVERGNFPLAWIAIRPSTDAPFELMHCECSREGLAAVAEAVVAAVEGNDAGGLAQALAANETYVVNRPDALDDPSPWLPLAREKKLGSFACFPLQVDGDVVGMMVLHADEDDFFDEQELRLLSEMAADTSLGLTQIANEEKVHYLAYYDVLTGLANRALFDEYLATALKKARAGSEPLAVVLLNIDRFRELNHGLGRHVGDRVLRTVATFLRQTFGDTDTVARFGNDEFGVILADLERIEDLPLAVEELTEKFPGPELAADKELLVTASIGVAVFPEDGRDGETLLKNAGIALRTVREEPGTNVQFASAEIDARSRERHKVEKALLHAIEKEELSSYFQPIVDLESGRIVGAEALLRWQCHRLGKISPLQFIPIAEESGLILPIGMWILEDACRHARDWNADRPEPLRVSINVSVKQLKEGFVAQVGELLERLAIDPALLPLALEVTESELMRHFSKNVTQLTKLKEMGFEIYVDDFGTGYSSLSYLTQLPIDKLKIDLSFIRNVPGKAEDRAIVEAIVAMGHKLDLRIIAEGVESEEQRAFLQRCGCDFYQGYLGSKPVPAAEFARLLQKDD